MTATEQVILVDKYDQPVGIAEKLQAHQDNLCHRAFSVFIFKNDSFQEVLLQQRADDKYHSGGLWTNTCCSHPRPGEEIIAAGERRLYEEMGLKCHLRSLGSFHYIAPFENGLTENEVDHVLIGTLQKAVININPAEVKAFKWVSIQDLENELQANPQSFTRWFYLAWDYLQQNLN